MATGDLDHPEVPVKEGPHCGPKLAGPGGHKAAPKGGSGQLHGADVENLLGMFPEHSAKIRKAAGGGTAKDER